MTTYLTQVLYKNIDLKIRNKLHGPMHYKISVTLVFSSLCNEFTSVWSMFLYNSTYVTATINKLSTFDSPLFFYTGILLQGTEQSIVYLSSHKRMTGALLT